MDLRDRGNQHHHRKHLITGAPVIDIIAPYLFHISIALAVIALLIIVGMILLVRRAASAAPDAAPADAAPQPEPDPGVQAASASAADVVSEDSAKSLGKSFKAAMKLLRKHVSGRNYRYQIPWFAMLGEADGGKTSALSGVDLTLPLGGPNAFTPASKRLCNWWFFDRGVVLDLSGDAFLSRDGRTSNEGVWRGFLRQLQRYRPLRPIDGIILTISAADLYGPDRLSEEALREKADIFNRKLWQLQKVLGLFFPVYVLVTKCDRVDGFSDFWRGVPLHRQHEIFGWSSPYAVDAAYSPSWANEVFSATGDSLLDTQLELAANSPPGINPEKAFLFPGEFSSLRQPLGDYLDHVFQPSVYHENFFLRGVYFSGDIAADTFDIGSIVPNGQVRPSLLTQLFEKKIFAEIALARPAAQSTLSGNRTVLALKAALAASIIVFSTGLWFSYSSLDSDLGALRPILHEVSTDIDIYKKRQAISVKDSAVIQSGLESMTDENARRLLGAMTHIQTNTLAEPFMPSSWFSGINARVGDFIAQGFDHIIMRAMHDDLVARAKTLLTPATSVGGSAQNADQAENGAALNRLTTFIDQLAELEKNISSYNSLSEPKNLPNIFSLSEYLFDITLPEEFLSYPEYYQRAVESVGERPVALESLSGRATTRVREMTWQLYDEMFHSGALPRHLYDLTVQLRKVEAASGERKEDAIEFGRLGEALNNADSLLKLPQFAWMSNDQFMPGANFARIMGQLATLKVIDPALVGELAQTGSGELDRFKQRLAAYKTNQFGSILSPPQSGQPLQFSPQLESLRKALPTWYAQRFMEVRPRQKFLMSPGMSEESLLWNPAKVERAIAYYRDYDQFIATQLTAFPEEFHDRVIALSLARLDANMSTSLAQAQEFKATTTKWDLRQDDGLSEEIRDFSKVASSLTRLLTITQQNGMNESYADLYEATLMHTISLLEKVDRRLDSEGLYLAEDLTDWDGRFPVAGSAFLAQDEAEVQHYLDAQRQSLDVLHRQYAEPLLTFLSSDHFRYESMVTPLTNKWQRIVLELGKYHNRRPGSTVTRLEKFIRFDALELTAANCYDKLGRKSAKAQSGDFFLLRLQRLEATILKRCGGLSVGEVGSRYAAVADMFNRRLANRFPFAQPRPGEVTLEASLDDIRDYYHRFDAEAPAIRTLIENSPGLGRSRDEALAFIDDMIEVRQFLDPLLSKTKATPTFDVAVAFRVNRTQEIDANQIIGWTLDLGGQKINRTDKVKKGVWRFGDDVRFALRWAKDSPTRPIPNQKSGAEVSADKTLTHVYGGNWGLMRLLMEHQDRQGLAPHTLRFNTDTQIGQTASIGPIKLPTIGTGNMPSIQGASRVFVRVELSAKPTDADAPKGYVMPRFPTSAPALVGGN